MGRVLLVRHGETMWNRERRIQGWASTELSERGHEQVACLGESITDEYEIHRVVSSDLRRTEQTAKPLANAIGVDISFDDRWRERNFGVCQGLLYEEFSEQFPELSVTSAGEDAIDAGPEDGETLREMYERIIAAWDDAKAMTGMDETTLIVTHGGPIALLLGHIKGIGPVDALLEHRLANCAINEITLPALTVIRENHTFAQPGRGSVTG